MSAKGQAAALNSKHRRKLSPLVLELLRREWDEACADLHRLGLPSPPTPEALRQPTLFGKALEARTGATS